MSEAGDFDPGVWTGHNFKTAYDHYDKHAGRSYADAKAKSKPVKEVLAATIETKCTNPLVIMCDVTGSMGEWPKVMFSKLPYLELEGKEYLGKDLQIAFGAIGDAYPAQSGGKPDTYPLQMRPFTSGTDLKVRMEELVIEEGGGGQIHETYELGALYGAHNVSMPNAIRPIWIMVGDELPYDFVPKDLAQKVAGVSIPKQLTTEEVFRQLKEKFAVYFIRKPYGHSSGNRMNETDSQVRNRWIQLLGADHVCDLPEAARVVDVIFGILAKETGREAYFRKEIEDRQKPDQVATVYKSLATVHLLPKPSAADRTGRSVLVVDDSKAKPATRIL